MGKYIITILAYGDASFACGDWTDDDDEPYKDLLTRQQEALKAVEDAIAALPLEETT